MMIILGVIFPSRGRRARSSLLIVLLGSSYERLIRWAPGTPLPKTKLRWELKSKKARRIALNIVLKRELTEKPSVVSISTFKLGQSPSKIRVSDVSHGAARLYSYYSGLSIAD